MTAIQFHVNEVFDIPTRTRGGLIAVGSTRNGDFVGIPRLRDARTHRVQATDVPAHTGLPHVWSAIWLGGYWPVRPSIRSRNRSA
jgi:hypothetical protein